MKDKHKEKISIAPPIIYQGGGEETTSEDDFSLDESKYPRSNSLRRETELFRDQDYIPHDMVSIKRIDLNSGEDWQIMLNKKTVLILTGSRFTSKEREFLGSIAGMNFIISGYKSGWKSVSEFKRQIKKYI